MVEGERIKKDEMGSACGTYTGELHAGLWLENLKERPTGNYTRRWEDNIKMDFKEIEWEGVDWISLSQERDKWRSPVNAHKVWGIS
jgi:hypothetical protein